MRTLFMSCSYCGGTSVINSADKALTSPCPYCMNGAEPVANFNYLASKKLQELLVDGFHVNGVSIQREIDGHFRRGFVTVNGRVHWWHSDEERTTWNPKKE